jgi:hypothetical protein
MWDFVALVLAAVAAFLGIGAACALYLSASSAADRAAVLEKDAATARLEQERLKQQVAWRRLNKSEHDKIVEALRGPPLDITVAFNGGDPEASYYARDIYRTLVDAGMTVQWSPELVGARATGSLLYGVIVWPMANGEETRLKGALAAAEIETNPSEDVHPNLKLTVGSKPRPF